MAANAPAQSPDSVLVNSTLPVAKMPFFNLHDFVSLLTAAICVLLVIYQFFLPKTKPLSAVLLGLFFLSLGAAAVSNVLLWNAYISINSILLKNLIPWFFSIVSITKGVFLYLYVASLTQHDFKINYKNFLYATPLLIVLVMLWVFQIDADNLRFIGVHKSPDDIQHVVWVWHFLRITPFIYAILAVIMTFYYHNNLKEYYSSYTVNGPVWLSVLTIGFALNWGWALATHFGGRYLPVAIADSLGIADNYITLVLLNGIFIYSFVYSHKLEATKTLPKGAEAADVTHSSLSGDELTKIRNGMEVDQLYLKNNLNIEEFSKCIGLSYREVSSIINKHFQTNFYEFVNLYRVNKAKELLLNPDYADRTILDIFLESGFNSKSAFNRFFKRYVGVTATEFRKNPLAQQKREG
ncbi:helix-turn-helix domain-containing protein [Cellvibrio fibrivorans]|uniref:AraC-like DNA-binding protein n=1 Tax=Cellvibrio fibrivorans TaxID=126350 RepID=A0ABU1V173_9GAMM|nr:helix-turn-helix domain-containing protein [Cellvibrio fibrivorans]MDR7091206.1 AraC-like DNA-binding protein [Cellvibrio fibrivorans]